MEFRQSHWTWFNYFSSFRQFGVVQKSLILNKIFISTWRAVKSVRKVNMFLKIQYGRIHKTTIRTIHEAHIACYKMTNEVCRIMTHIANMIWINIYYWWNRQQSQVILYYLCCPPKFKPPWYIPAPESHAKCTALRCLMKKCNSLEDTQ